MVYNTPWVLVLSYQLFGTCDAHRVFLFLQKLQKLVLKVLNSRQKMPTLREKTYVKASLPYGGIPRDLV